MIWERDYMRRRSDAKGDADAADTTDPTDIFAGIQQQPLHSQAPPTASDDSKTRNSVITLGSSVPQAAGQPELPLNRLLAKYPRFFWYAAIAILGIIIGILLGRKL
ncbi:MAG TPA: hypothetical protein VK769_03080 [Verrucomicrobiae bacterium]|jgi:hypothetical protein|nr:hypothetical protein [Verrucomicrobiae bacterium]